MASLITGSTGFIGAHLVRALLERGERVRCLVRPSTSRANIAGLFVEVVEGDVRDAASLERAIDGVDTVYHCAADYRLFARRCSEIYRTNVEGTERVCEACARLGVRRLVYTSSVGALGLRRDGRPADEETAIERKEVVGHYKRSKFDAERVIDSWVERGLPVVVTCPSTPVGEMDIKPTPTGQIIVDFLAGRMRAYVATGLNLIDVKDVAIGHLLAAERGRIGERYILGHQNLMLKEIFEILSRVSGVPAPRVRLPSWVPIAFGAVDTALARVTGGAPRVPLEGARMATKPMYFDASKAIRELGLPQSPIEAALERAVSWFRSRGYA